MLRDCSFFFHVHAFCLYGAGEIPGHHFLPALAGASNFLKMVPLRSPIRTRRVPNTSSAQIIIP